MLGRNCKMILVMFTHRVCHTLRPMRLIPKKKEIVIAIENCVNLRATFSIRSQAKENKVLPSCSLSLSCCYLVGSEWKLCSLEQIEGRVTMMELYCYDYITVVLQRAIPALNKIGYLSYGYMYTLL